MAGLTDAELAALVSDRTMTGPERIQAMIDQCRRIDREGISGCIVECGVWRGGNILIARVTAPSRVCWLYDTFTGMTMPGPEDVKVGSSRTSARSVYHERTKHSGGWARAGLDEVHQTLDLVPGALDRSKLRIVTGDVNETLLDPVNLPDEIALLRLDTDWYASTSIELKLLYPRLVRGGAVIIDDYGHWAGSRRATNEYFGGSFPWTWIDKAAVMAVKGGR